MVKRVLVFSYDYPPLLGGIARFSAEIVRLFKQDSEIACTVLTKNQTGKIERDLTSLRALRKWNTQAGTVICANWYPEGILAILAGCKDIVILAHGTEILPSRNSFRRPLWKVLIRFALARARRVIANSSYTANLVKEACPKAKISWLPLGVDTKKFFPAEKFEKKQELKLPPKKLFFTISRLHRYKGIETVLQAMAKLTPEQRTKFIYLIAGDGNYKKDLINLAEALRLESCVKLLGSLSEEELLKYYQAADLFLLCSWEERKEQNVEGFGLVFLEAQACGTPVIGTRSGGIPSAVSPDHGGWLIDERNDLQLSQLLSRILADENLLAQQGLEARRRVEREYTWDNYYAKFKQIVVNHGI